MEELMQRRIEVLGRVHEIRNSEERPQEDGAGLDRELAGLYPTLPMAWLTSALYATGAAFVGFLYNTGSTLYVCSDSDNKWLYAAKSTTSGAVRWSIYQDSVGNLVLNATIGGTVY